MAYHSSMKTAPGLEPILDRMAAVMSRAATTDGFTETQVPRLTFIRSAEPYAPVPAVYEPAVCVVAQGMKRVILADEVHLYGRARYLVTAVDIPVQGQVLEASPQKPYLCLMLRLDVKAIASLVLESDIAPVDLPPSRGLYVSTASVELLDALLRLALLVETPADIAALAPLVEREILYRLLRSEEGWRLRQVGLAHTHSRRIARAIEWLRRHYAEPVSVERMAREAHMSASAFHEHFKAVTAMSPLQFQKQLRLQEARRLLLSEALDAATAGHRVGYGSPSQFSREYSRLFGAPPASDLKRLRAAQA